MLISSLLGVQGPLVMVQVKVFIPIDNPVTPLVGLDGVVTIPLPAVTVHVPVPSVGEFAAKFAVFAQID